MVELTLGNDTHIVTLFSHFSKKTTHGDVAVLQPFESRAHIVKRNCVSSYGKQISLLPAYLTVNY